MHGTLQPNVPLARSAAFTLPVFATGDSRIVVLTDAGLEHLEGNATGTGESNNTAVDDRVISLLDTLTLSISPTQFLEDASVAGATAATGTLTRSGDATASLPVTLISSELGRLVLPDSLSIPAGKSSLVFPIYAVDNERADGDHVVTVQAATTGFESSEVDLLLIDDDVPTLTLTIHADSVREDDSNPATTATVTRNSDNSAPLDVGLLSANPDRLTALPTVTIPADEDFLTFNVDVVNNNLLDGSGPVTLYVSANDFIGGSDQVEVIDDDIPQLTLIFSSSTVSEGDSVAGGHWYGHSQYRQRQP